jgi:uncharacterized membrane protein
MVARAGVLGRARGHRYNEAVGGVHRMSRVLSNRVVFLLSLVGVGVAAYLTLAHLDYLSLQCGMLHGCEEVAMHPTAHGFGIAALSGIPTAAFGLLMFVAMAGLSFARVAAASPAVDRLCSALQWWMSLAALGVAAWLTYTEAYVIHAWCQWCIATAVIIAFLFAVLTAVRIAAARATAAASSGSGLQDPPRTAVQPSQGEGL